MKLESEKKAFRRDILLFAAIMLTAVLLRVLKYAFYDGGLNQDEASIGYDAYALLKYGIDRNGMSLPVHLIAWGSGQNALYAYLSMPFIALLGLNAYSVRLLNLLCGIATVAAVYPICRELFSEKRVAFIAMTLTAIAPWHIMLSCWGLESNLFPAMLVFSLLLLVKSFKKPWLICLAAAMFSLSLYSYGAAYAVVPIFLLLAVIMILRKKLIPLKYVAIAFGIFVIMSVPIGLFVLINKLGWDSICIGPVTIPAMTGVARLNTVGETYSVQNVITNIWNNVILQFDGRYRNAIPFYGCLYIISLPLTVIGIVIAAARRSIGDWLVLFAFASGFCLLFIYGSANINRVNALYIPMILLTAIGMDAIVRTKQISTAMICVYAVLLCGFCGQFYGKEYNQRIESESYRSLGEAIEYANALSEQAQGQAVHVTSNINMPYIYVLFYTQEDPNTYLNTVKFERYDVEFQQVSSFGKWIFNTEGFFERQPGIYVVENSWLPEEEDGITIRQFQLYSVVTVK